MDVASIQLRNRLGRERTIDDITTLFDLCLVVLDARRPSSYEPLLPVIEHIDAVLSGADCTVGVLVAGADEADADRALGPLARQVAVFVDPQGRTTEGLGVAGTPALVWITTAPEITGMVEGWDPRAWQGVLDRLARKLGWTRPLLTQPGAPAPFAPRPLGVPRPADVHRPAHSAH